MEDSSVWLDVRHPVIDKTARKTERVILGKSSPFDDYKLNRFYQKRISREMDSIGVKTLDPKQAP